MTIRIAITLLIGLILGGAIGFAYERHDLSDLKKKPAALRTDSPFIDRAVALWSAKTRQSAESSMQGRYARAMHFPSEICIELGMQTGGVGGAPIYCFDRKTQGLTRKFDEVE